MDEYLNKGIKEVIDRFPEVANILDEYGVGCASCGEGDCLLKEIVEVHHLPPEEEQEMMARIWGAIDPDRAVAVRPRRRRPAAAAQKHYSLPIQNLVDEHGLIKRWVALIPQVIEYMDSDFEGARDLIRQGVDFIRSYADRYHHAKEEDELFQYFDQNMEILKTMYADHEKARGHVRELMTALEREDRQGVAQHLGAYGEILKEHIRKEDEILYPWMDDRMEITQLGDLQARFEEIDEEFAESRSRYQAFIEKAERILRNSDQETESG